MIDSRVRQQLWSSELQREAGEAAALVSVNSAEAHAFFCLLCVCLAGTVSHKVTDELGGVM